MNSETVAGLRALADFLERHPELEVRLSRALHNCATKEEFLGAIKSLGSFKKEVDSIYFNAIKDFGGGVELEVYANRSNICTRQTHTETIVEKVLVNPQYEERTVTREVVEWDCPPSIMAELDKEEHAR